MESEAHYAIIAKRQFVRGIFLLLFFVVSLVFRVGASDLALDPEEADWVAKHKVLRIGVTPDWPPFEYIDKNGDYRGLSADFIRLVTESLGIKLEIVSADDSWDVVMKKLKNKELDGVGSIFVSEARRPYINFSHPYVDVPHLIIVREKDESFARMEDLNGRKLAYMRGWVCQEFIERDYPGIRLSLSPALEGMIGQVLLGTSDAGLIDFASLAYYSRLHNLSGLKVAMISPYAPKLAFGFPESDKVAAALFDKAMAAVPEEKLEQIKDKWLRGPDTNARKFKIALQSLAGIAFIALLVFFWNVLLQRRVAERTKALEKEIEQNRRQAVAIKESEGKIRAIFDQTLQFIGLLTIDGTLIEANKSSMEFVKGEPEDLIGRKFWETPWWSHSAELQAKLKESIEQVAQGAIIRFESTHKDFNGKIHYIDFSLKKYQDEFSRIDYLIAEGHDISQEHESLMSLKDSEERFRLLFESSPDPCWLIQDEKFIECNVSAMILFGFKAKDDFLGLHPAALSPEYQPDGQLSYAVANEIMAKGLAKGVVRFEWEHKRLDGSIFPVEITLSSVMLKGKLALYCIGRDLTERRKAEQESKRLQEQFLQAQKMESIGRLAGGVAHDFNNLLTGIRGFTELILFEPDLPESVCEMLNEISKAGISATALTRQLLAFSRKQIFEPHIINLNELVLHLQKLLVRLLGEDVTLKLSLNKDLGSCFADPGQIEQVLVNLSVNARDAMPGGGILILETANVYFDESVELDVPLAPGQYLMLAVSDNGTGMTEEVKKHMFEPFYTTKESGKGTGLGLATVYGVVRQSGGNIVVYSEPGHGTTFKIYLPRVSGDAEIMKVEADEIQNGNGELIILAEDEALLRNLVTRGLPEFGYRVIAFADGNSALEWLKDTSECPAMLVTDVVMPGINGRQFADKVQEARSGLPTLFVSGYTEDAIVSHGILQNDIKFLAKPFSISTLAAKIGAILAEAARVKIG